MKFVYFYHFNINNNNKFSKIMLFNDEQTNYVKILLFYLLILMDYKLFKLNVANYTQNKNMKFRWDQ